MLDKIKNVDWEDTRRKLWHLSLMLAAAYTAYDPRFAWAAPVLTAAAGLSKTPNGGGQ